MYACYPISKGITLLKVFYKDDERDTYEHEVKSLWGLLSALVYEIAFLIPHVGDVALTSTHKFFSQFPSLAQPDK